MVLFMFGMKPESNILAFTHGVLNVDCVTVWFWAAGVPAIGGLTFCHDAPPPAFVAMMITVAPCGTLTISVPPGPAIAMGA